MPDPDQELSTRVAVLEDRMSRLQNDMELFKADIKDDLKSIQQAIQANSFSTWLGQNWKYLVIVSLVFLGKDITTLAKALGL